MMIMRLIILATQLLLLSISSYVKGQQKGIIFEDCPFDSAIVKSINASRPVFIDFYTDWCGPCKVLDANVFRNDSVGEYFNSKFINLKINAEKGEGIFLAKKYDIFCYPSVIFINPDGSLIHRYSGGNHSPEMFLSVGKDVFVKERTFSYQKEHYNQLSKSDEWLLSYIKLRQNGCQPINNELTDYFSRKKDDEILTKSCWTVIQEFVNSHQLQVFNRIIKLQKELIEAHGEDVVNEKFDEILWSDYYYCETFQEKEKLISFIENSDLLNKDYFSFQFKVYNAIGKDDWKSFFTLLKHRKESFVEKPFYVRYYAGLIIEHSKTPEQLKYAEEIINRFVNIQGSNDFAILYLYAKTLYKLRKTDEGKNVAKKALLLYKNGEIESTKEFDEYAAELTKLIK